MADSKAGSARLARTVARSTLVAPLRELGMALVVLSKVEQRLDAAHPGHIHVAPATIRQTKCSESDRGSMGHWVRS